MILFRPTVRFAECLPLLFHFCSIKFRHAVNKAVSSRVLADADAFAQYEKLVNDPSFLPLLQAAKEDPKGPEALKVLKLVLPFINMTANKIPFGNMERAGEVTKEMAVARHHSPSSNFWTVAPHDVHHPLSVRLAHPWRGYNQFPSTAPPGFSASLLVGRARADAPAGFEADEDSLQMLAARNPVACMLMHTKLIRTVESDIFQVVHTRDRKKTIPIWDVRKGAFGRAALTCNVTEFNKRGSAHAHGSLYGGLTPALVGECAAGFCCGAHATRADSQRVRQLLNTVGKAEEVPEKLMDAVTGLSGSGPAYGFLLVEALADGGVRAGLPRPIAQALAAQTVKGAAAMVLETGKHPGERKRAAPLQPTLPCRTPR